MRSSLVLRTLQATEWPLYRDIRLRSLAESPDAFGSTLAAEQGRSEQAWAERLSAAAVSGQDCPLVAEHHGEIVGLVWAKVDALDTAAVNLFQMWVAPECRGQGVGSTLLQVALDWARHRNARCVQLGVACGDTPAVRLYTRAGFEFTGGPEPLRPGSELRAQSMQLRLVKA